MKLVQISDLHLTADGGLFNDNWETTLGWIEAAEPDLVVVSGDVALGGKNVDRDLEFARGQLDRIRARWRVLPGNHDIGDNPFSGSKNNPVSAPRLARWRGLFGPDCWIERLGGWAIVGVNSQILNAPELGEESIQGDYLEKTLSGLDIDAPLAIFTHKPLFLDRPSEEVFVPDCIDPVGRKNLAGIFSDRNVRLVACGHKHQYRSFGLGRVRYFWAPAVACVNKGPQEKSWGLRQVGFIEYELTGDNLRHKVHGADFLMRHESYIQIGEHGALDAPTTARQGRGGLW